ncbi:YihY/virulence factor BrkB family protein [Roseomonas sp. BN140053]|uniref:YihY/virulence factor BrkB family protein n=1 Tax=Roseomonas sp. BN140053 TaxID=3391898 RepID=UPI0039E9F095
MLRRAWVLLKESLWGFLEDGAMMSGAAIAFYAIFSLAPVLVIAVAIAGYVFGQDAARNAVADQVREVMGDPAAETITNLLASAGRFDSGLIASVISLVTIIVTATGTFGAIESALNMIWRSETQYSAIRSTLRTRLTGLCLTLAVGLLLIATLVADALLAALKHTLEMLPHTQFLADAANTAVSGLVLMLAVGAMYRVLPQRRLPWRDVLLGAGVTTLLLSLGRYGIGLYMTGAGVATTYGAAGSLFVVLLWIYYSALIFLFGAEFTKAFTKHYSADRLARQEAARASR